MISAIIIYLIIVITAMIIYDKKTHDSDKIPHDIVLIGVLSIFAVLAIWVYFIVPKDIEMKQKDYYIHQLLK